jgi:uncharacterized protein
LAVYFLDTSALVKLYVQEAGSDRLYLLTEAGDNSIVLSSLAQVEFRSAIRKRERMRETAPLLAKKAIELFERHLETDYVTRSIDAAILDRAKALVDRHGLRAYDAVQLASCLALEQILAELPILVCGDLDLLRAAVVEGLDVLNPTD